ncbi:MAG: hypothetical protein J1E35_04040 [Lachnospiraceae bacterium]|nr:hypothetical protein [Lachnospiraceae bacterium]
MNQNFNSPPPILAPSSELGALLFAALPCIHENYRPLASFAFHMTELSRLKNLPPMPPLSKLNNIDSLIADKETFLRSLSFYGNLFHMPLLSAIANILQAMQFYRAYKDILPGLFSAMGGNGGAADSMSGLFSGLGGLSPDILSAFGGLSPELLSSLLSGFSSSAFNASSSDGAKPDNNSADFFHAGGEAADFSREVPEPDEPVHNPSVSESDEPLQSFSASEPEEPPQSFSVSGPEESETSVFEQAAESNTSASDTSASDTSFDLYDSLYSLLTPEQKAIYEQLMHTDQTPGIS